MKRYYLLMLLVCLLGSNALAQTRTTYTTTTEVKEIIDFTGWKLKQNQWGYETQDAQITWAGAYIQSISGTGTNDETLSRSYTDYPISVSNPGDTNGDWHLWGSGSTASYLQKNGTNTTATFSIGNLKKGDVVTIYGDKGNQDGYFQVTSGNTNHNNVNISFDQDHKANQDLTMNGDGTLTLTLQFYGNYSGILKIEIKKNINQTTTFDYDPGYEEYDMYDEFSWEKSGNPATTYNFNNGSAGFQLNGADAKYITFAGSKITANNRIALTGNANAWTFDFGLVPPGTNGDYSYFSICNLREGDRVVISYINESEDPLIFASGKKDGEYYYDGCAAFKDDNRNGILNDGEEYVSNGYVAPVDWHRGEGNVAGNDQGQGASFIPELNYINSYVITQDGHLDLAFRRFVQNGGNQQNPNKRVSRIVKIKIYSDHQAMMVDEYDANSYWAKFNITGELQAKEHIMPGGLEIQIGNDDATQHALVVSSKYGPVSYVNAVDGFKIPGVSKNGDQININFDLGINGDVDKLPTTGTFYKFIPEVNGKIKFKFEAKSMNYYRWDLKGNSVYQNTSLGGNWAALNDRPNEQTVDATCPYYLVKVVNGQVEVQRLQKINQQGVLDDIYNGGDYETPDYIDVQVGEEYYLFGGWNQTGLYYNSSWTTPDISNDDRNNDANGSKVYNNIEFRPFDGRKVGCGIAQLLWVEFDPDKKIYPLAKWVPNGTKAVKTGSGVPNPDTFETEEYLADLWGYNENTSITVKKMSGNITACNPYLQQVQGNHYRLMIDGIEFDDDNNKDQGGTILIKIGDATQKVSPVYALTIAYSTDPTYDGNSGTGTRGHIWDYSSNTLQGLDYHPATLTQPNPGVKGVYEANAANPVTYGHYFADYFGADISDCSSKDEVLAKLQTSGSGLLYYEIDEGNSDWMFNYNLVNAGKLYDPLFSNKYDLEGDNADLIWNTEGTVLKTSANASVMFNEFTGANVHQSEKDPDRYVGILQGGEFRIPWLRKNDRVIIYMGVGKGAFNDQAVFSIRGAYDAVHNVIDPADDYVVGGSQWNSANSDNNYRGCYHFFAQGGPTVDGKTLPADMVFKMTGGSMCKIYSIQIYRGDRIITNEVIGATEDDKFLLWSRAADPNDKDDKAAIGDTYNWTLKYFGKEQKLADGTNDVNNDFAAKTGCINYELITETDPTKATYNTFSYPNDYGQIGTFRVRGKDMEKNMKYVADYGEHNVTVAYQQTMKYPYTWDFMDMTGWGNNVQNFVYEDGIGSLMTSRPAWYDSDDLWNASYEKSSSDLSLWEVDSQDNTYYLRLNSQSGQTSGNLKEVDNIFETAKDIDGNQVWANGAIVPETQGLWFYTLNNNRNNNTWGVTNDGLAFNGLSTTIQKVVVPNVPAGAAVYLRMVTDRDTYDHAFEFKGGNSGYKVYGPELVTGTTDEYILAVRNDGAKRHLTFSLAGYQLKKLSVSTDPKSVNIKGYASESRDHAIDASLLPYFTDKPIKSYLVSSPDYTKHTITLTDVSESPAPVIPAESGYVIYNPDNANDTGEFNLFGDNKGFHLFVPDMHDDEKSEGKFADVETNDEFMIPVLKQRTGDEKLMSFSSDGKKTNYVLSYKWYDLKPDGSTTGTQHVGDEMFYRVSREGINLRANSAYLVLDTEALGLKTSQGSAQSAKFTFVFSDWNDTPSVPTAIEEANSVETFDPSNGEWYNMNGQKLNGIPATKGLYIMNGKKVLVK